MSKELITSFYDVFQQGDGEAMASMYHPDARFSDPVFQNLTSTEAGAMWQMLIECAGGNLEITFHSIEESEEEVRGVWEAKYPFSRTGRRGHNVIQSRMKFRNGKIIDHRDSFNFWKWLRMALGISGVLLGWTPVIKNKVRAMARKGLDYFMNKDLV